MGALSWRLFLPRMNRREQARKSVFPSTRMPNDPLTTGVKTPFAQFLRKGNLTHNMKSYVSPAILALLALTTVAEPLKLHPTNPHYFLFRDRSMVIITSGEHYGAVLNLDFDFKKYLTTLKQDRLNNTR